MLWKNEVICGHVCCDRKMEMIRNSIQRNIFKYVLSNGTADENMIDVYLATAVQCYAFLYAFHLWNVCSTLKMTETSVG